MQCILLDLLILNYFTPLQLAICHSPLLFDVRQITPSTLDFYWSFWFRLFDVSTLAMTGIHSSYFMFRDFSNSYCKRTQNSIKGITGHALCQKHNKVFWRVSPNLVPSIKTNIIFTNIVNTHHSNIHVFIMVDILNPQTCITFPLTYFTSLLPFCLRMHSVFLWNGWTFRNWP